MRTHYDNFYLSSHEVISPFKAQRLVETCPNWSLFRFVEERVFCVIYKWLTERRETSMPIFKGAVALETESNFQETWTKWGAVFTVLLGVSVFQMYSHLVIDTGWWPIVNACNHQQPMRELHLLHPFLHKSPCLSKTTTFPSGVCSISVCPGRLKELSYVLKLRST